MELTQVQFNPNLMNSDAFFTGFNEAQCAYFRRLKRNPDTVSLESVTVNPSIRMAKNLKRFKMALTQISQWPSMPVSVYYGRPFISEVTGLYAFNRMPELNVVFSFDFNGPCAEEIARTLSPLKRYVQIVPETPPKEEYYYRF